MNATRNGRRLIVLSALGLSLIVGGCAQVKEFTSGLEVRQFERGGSSGSNAKPFTKRTAAKKPRRGRHVAYDYDNSQVPHTLMRKPVAEGRLTSRFGFRLSPTGILLPKKHKGIDYAAPEGTPIFASGDGVINKRYVSKSYGNFISVEHANDFVSVYAHMQRFVDGLDEGTPVKRGQIIGYVGSTGRSTNNHLHYELRHRGKRVDPLFAQPPS